MRSFDSDTLAALAAGRVAMRTLIVFDFASGLYGFWDGIGTTSYAGQDYVGAGQLITMNEANFVSDLVTSTLEVRLTAIPDSGLDPDVLGSIESEAYHQRPVTISRAYYDPDSRAILSVERLFKGFVDQVEHDVTIGGEAVLIGKLESRARDFSRKGHRVRSDTDQRRIDVDDGGLRHAATSGNQDIYWGKLPGKIKE